MNNLTNQSNKSMPRENLRMAILNKLAKEYKAFLEHIRRTKLFKIIEINQLSDIPGETKFTIQITNKNCALQLTAAEIINNKYNLNDFNNFHAEMIRNAAQGKLIDFLKLSDTEPAYKIASKMISRDTQEFIFTIETREQVRFTRTAAELSIDKNLLENMGITDIYDIGFTPGSESVLKEKTVILLAKHK